jgi:hypothetical protein
MNMKKTTLVTLTVVLLLAFTACNDDSKPDPECDCTVKAHNAPCECGAAGTPACGCTVIQRTFTIDGFAKPITVTDARTGDNDTDLETLGVISRLKTGLTSTSGNHLFDQVIDRGITIAVEDTTAYSEPCKVYSGNKLGIRFAYISGNAEHLSDTLAYFITTEMYNAQ